MTRTVAPSGLARWLSPFALKLALAAACGGTAEPDGFAKYPATQVQQTFQALTGVKPAVTFKEPGYVEMAPAGGTRRNGAVIRHFGLFTIDVTADPAAESGITDGFMRRTAKPGADGIYWSSRYDGTGAVTWIAQKGYHNVVLHWFSPLSNSRKTDATFAATARILEQLGKPLDEARAALPPSELPCPAAGISVSSGQGTCLQDATTVTYADHGSALHLPWATVRVARAEIGKALVSRNNVAGGARARGRLLLVRLTVRNNGPAPQVCVCETGVRLRVNGSTYHNDTGWGDYNTIGVIVLSGAAQPVTPGKEGQWPVTFDVPPAVAVQALRTGLLVFDGDEKPGDPGYASAYGYIRLRGVAPHYQVSMTP